MHPPLWLLTILALCATPATAGNDTATLPYASIYKTATINLGGIVNGASRQETRFTIASTRDGVKPQDIRIYIASKTGRIDLAISADGTMVFPLRADLLAENPLIVSNQPRGTMLMTIRHTANTSSKNSRAVDDMIKTGRGRYRDIFNIEAQLTEMVARVDQVKMGRLQPKAGTSPVVVTYRPPAQAPTVHASTSLLIIHSRRGSIKVTPEGDGSFRLVHDPRLAEENPWVSFPPGGKWEATANFTGRVIETAPAILD